MRIATLNMRGYGTPLNDGHSDKWMRINQIVRDNKITILALQETHLTAERIEVLNRVFASSLVILGSPDPVNQTGARGVAFVLNKKLAGETRVEYTEPVPGRAIKITYHWKNNTPLNILNVYAPNATRENETFWNALKRTWEESDQPNPDIMLGDFNLVEAPIDRLPAHGDDSVAAEALRDLRRMNDLTDGWRNENPSDRAFTYAQASTMSQSRIDRIYITSRLEAKSVDWTIQESGIPTDHKIVSMALANYRAPTIGRGRWQLPKSLVRDHTFITKVKELGRALQEAIRDAEQRNADTNPQTLYRAFKDNVIREAKTRMKTKIPKLESRIKKVKTDLRETLAKEDINTSEPARRHAMHLQEEINKMELKRFEHRRAQLAARDWLEGETPSKYWSRTNAPPKPDEVVYELLDPKASGESPTYSNKSGRMAEIAKEHYDSLQSDHECEEAERKIRTEDILDSMSAKLEDYQKEELAERLSWMEVETAIREAATGKSPGLDGIPAELWKECYKHQLADAKKNKPTFNVVTVLKEVYNDIETFGIEEGTDFSKGWICPIYKKKDKRKAENYRPITLLNADYKILTRAIAMRLASVAPTLIHPDQAGFIPGRQIFHHIKLTKALIDYAEAEEVNGVIVALDQEKAYDRINHEYLWQVLDRMGFPPSFINTVKALYKGAESVVMINGTASKAFIITRGVRQGDPMSCLLFNLAIEPLAHLLRESELIGLNVPGLQERLINLLFADDTTVFLHENDDFAKLEEVLTKWCKASRAKFNKEKTEVIPIGSLEYRSSVLRTRTLNRSSPPLPTGIKIADEGVAVRLLGAWIGNKIDETAQWTKITETIERNLDRWAKRNPTLGGRKLIVGMEVGGRTQFLTRAQTMPNEVEARLSAMITKFIWKGGKSPRISKEQLQRQVQDGGLNLLDLEARNEAIDLVGLEEYMRTGETRPKWAYIADALLARAVTARSRNVDNAARINTFLQTWDVTASKQAGLPNDLRRMVKTAKKYNVKMDSPNPAKELRDAMPIWYHLGIDLGKTMANTTSGRCLRDNHQVVTTLDCIRIADRNRANPDHRRRPSCECNECHRDRTVHNCENPARCVEAATKLVERLQPKWNPTDAEWTDGLSLTKSRKRKNERARTYNDRIVFDPSIQDGPALEHGVRVFVDQPELPARTVRRPPRPFQMNPEETEVYTDGSCEKNGCADATAGSGLWYGHQDPRNGYFRVPGPQSNQTAELFAVEKAIDLTPPFATLHIITDSKYVIKGLTDLIHRWERDGWHRTRNSDAIVRLVAKLRKRSAQTTFKWVKGHDGDEGNEGADALAKEGAALQTASELIPANMAFVRRGLQLAGSTQKALYLGIRNRKRAKKGERTRTEEIMERVCESIHQTLNFRPFARNVWKHLRLPEVNRKARDFLWKGLHGALKIGDFWEHIPGYEHRAICRLCDEVESLEHILLGCRAKPVKVIWGLVRALATKKGLNLPELCFGTVLAGHVFSANHIMDTPPKGADRLMRIALTESAFLIWKMRCTRVIEWDDAVRTDHTEEEVLTAWHAVMVKRQLLDKRMTSATLGRKALDKNKVGLTWCTTPRDKGVNVSVDTGVLVGRLVPEYNGISRY